MADHKSFRPIPKCIALRPQRIREADRIAQDYSLSLIAARILAARGLIEPGAVKTYIEPSLKEGLPNPRALKGLDEACDLIACCADAAEIAGVCCDFDVDGLSGGAQLVHFLTAAGMSVEAFVPDRFAEGYGVNDRIIEEAKAKGCKLLICIDFGTTSLKEISLAKSLGLKTIVIDHHHVAGALPAADVFINPQQSGCGFADCLLSAAGLVWYLLVGLRKKLKNATGLDPRTYLDLAALGTICDMVPLLGVNRIIAKHGLRALGSTARPGLVALKGVSAVGREVSCYDVSFALGPRINAAGRMVHGGLVLELLTTENQSRADQLAHQLNRLNIERQDTELLVKEEAVQQLQKMESLPAGIVLWDSKFHTGVIGIVAQRLVEMYHRPTAVVGTDSEGILKGSVRGVRGFSVVQSLQDLSEYLIKFGGHDGAGGFSIEQKSIEKFQAAFHKYCADKLGEQLGRSMVEADTEVRLADLSLNLIAELKRFAPFGMGNPSPTLLARGLKVLTVSTIKGVHLKVQLADGNHKLTGILWRSAEHPALKSGARVDLAFRAEESNFNGLSAIQANIQAAVAA